jgi:methionyl-tRNA formyltransferase
MAPMIEKEVGRLDWRRPAVELERRMRAFTPWPGSFTTWQGGLLKVHGARVGQGRGEPGEVLAAGPEGLEVACGEGSLVLTRLQPEGKRVMQVGEFLAGHRLQPGERFPQ